ncbi:MAG: DUF6293 family protein [Candidatus Thermoplasmatota archaeon]|nr:DUF6293 family protein [Candidatus Thermoplasmatota archaeon]
MDEESQVVHIVPMGLEVDRVIGGLKRFPTNKLILIYGVDSTSEIEKKARANGKKIREMVKATMDVEEIEMDIFDFYSGTRKLRGLFEDLGKKGHSIQVNISTGNRIITSAALLACFMTGANPYYVRPLKYSIPEDQEVLSHGVDRVIAIPSVSINGPSPSEQAVLEVLGNMGGSARHETSLIAPLDDIGDLFKEKKDGESKKVYLARKRAHLSRVLRNLERKGYIRLVQKGRYVRVNLTDTGKLFSGHNG